MKLNQLIDVNALQGHEKETAKFKDSSGILLARHLTAVDPQVFNRLYPENIFLNAGFNIDNTGGYSESIQKIRLGANGDFIDANDTNSQNGLISLTGDEDTIKVIGKKARIEYSETEIEQAKLGNYNIVQKLFGAANMRYQQKIDSIIALGNTGGEGLLNYSNFTTDTASGTAETLAGDALYDEIADFINAQWSGVNNIPEYRANKVIFPLSVYNTIRSKIYKAESGTQKVLTALQEAFPSIEFGFSFRNEDVGGSSITVAYSTFREAMSVRIPVPLKVGKTVPMGSFGYSADLMFRIAGLDIAEDAAGRYLSGL